MRQQQLKLILFSVLFALLFLPFLQQQFSVFTFKPLTGEFIPAEKQNITMAGWLQGDFQKAYDKNYEENLGFRNFLIRFYNQVDFSFFNTMHAEVVAGKKGYLFQESYLNSFTGNDFIGEEKIKEEVRKIKFVKDRLKEKGISLVLAIAPSKVRFYPEYIPSYYLNRQTIATNYYTYKRMLQDEQVPFMDFIDYFSKLKDTTRYLLYPKQGIHWSQYGMYVVADSLLKKIRTDEGIMLNNLSFDSIEFTDQLRSTDYDLGDLSNVLFEMKHDKMPYPVLHFENDPAKPRPNVLVIGDSYYWNIYYAEIPKYIFSRANFWYYNHEVYADTLPGKQIVDQANFMNEVERQRIVIVLETEINLNKFGFGFFDLVYERYQNPDNTVAAYEKMIRNNPEWLEAVKQKAADRKIPLEQMIKSDAEWMAEQDRAKTH
ncbi:MAG: hypothetical protein ABI763_03280 [Bacteroidota bacterium]